MQNTKREKTIREVLFNEVSFAVSLLGVGFGVFIYLTNPSHTNTLDIQKLQVEFAESQKLSTQIQNIKDNDLHTIELKVKELQDLIINVNENVIRLQTTIEERFPKK